MNPRTLRALLPVLKEAREAGIRRIAAGEGKNRVEFELAPADPAPGPTMEAGTDAGAAADDAEDDPRYFLMKHHELVNAPSNGTPR